MKTSVGKIDGGPELEIDVPRLIETRLLVQANSGGGKSWLLRRILEQTASKVQQLVIDPEGEFPTLRERHDFVICAPHGGDAVAHPRTAALLARRLLETGVSAVLDIYELKAHERQEFVRLFCEALVNAPKTLWHPTLVVLDEAHVYAPEHGKSESAGAVIDLATRGRKRGYCLCLATQRLAKLHKDAAAEMLNKLIGRTGLDVDVKRAADELGMTAKEAVTALRNLDAGEFYAFGPALSREVVKVQVGTVRTTHPKVGQRLLAAPPAPSENVKKVLAALADLPKEAEQEARSLVEIKAENARLKRELTLAQKIPAKTPGPATKIERITVPIVGKKAIVGIQAAAKDINRSLAKSREVHKGWGATLVTIERRVDDLTKALERVTSAQSESPPVVAPAVVPATREVTFRPTPGAVGYQIEKRSAVGPTVPFASRPLGKCERAILATLALHMRDGCNSRKLALLAGYSWSGTFSNAVGALRMAGYLAGTNQGAMRITAEGLGALGDHEPLPTHNEGIRDYWRAKFGKCERQILDALFNNPHGLNKEKLCELTGYSWSGTFSNAVSRLRTVGCLVGPNTGVMRASEELLI